MIPGIKAPAQMARFLVVLIAANVALLSARRGPGGWNDASRLATVEAIVDHHTLSIDDSIFVNVNTADRSEESRPKIATYDTKDRILVNGHYYSHKPPLPAALLGAAYFVWKQVTGLSAREDPAAFCQFMTVISAGLPYVLAVASAFALGRRLGLGLARNFCLCASLGLSTLALIYTRNVNDHMMLLAVSFGVILTVPTFVDVTARADARKGIVVGSLTGFGYTLDSGAGASLFAATAALIAFRWIRWRAPLFCFCAAALPWVLAHHVLNYRISGTLSPAGSIMRYYRWPGAPFAPTDISGAWHHETFTDFVYYAIDMLFGRPGFLGHNLPVFLAGLALPILWMRRTSSRPELVWTVAYCLGTWLLYAAFGACYGGLCCPIRWFIPLLAPAYYLVAALLRERPRYASDLALLSAIGAVPAMYWWRRGPFAGDDFPWYWLLQFVALLTWTAMLVVRAAHHRLPASQVGGTGL